MLEFQTHQAAGLQALQTLAGPQLVAMVLHGDAQASQGVLRRLCVAYLELGYSVTVLDASQQESPLAPGLARMLDDNYWPTRAARPETAWQVLPAARGLQSLLAVPASGAPPWSRLTDLFAADSVVLVYAKPELLAALLHGSSARPLLAVSSAKNALLTSYQALKRLLVDGRLEPTIVNVAGLGGAELENPVHALPVANLAECARNFLGYQVHLLSLDAPTAGARGDYDLKPVAARLLESALPGPTSTHTAFAGTH